MNSWNHGESGIVSTTKDAKRKKKTFPIIGDYKYHLFYFIKAI